MNEAQLLYLADESVFVTDVLDLLGWHYNGVPSQLKCPVHKGGGETKSSARVHGDNRIWCYTCWKQYGASEIYAAVKGITRVEAAQILLQKWPASEEMQKEAIQKAHAVKRKPVSTAILNSAEEALLRYRHQVPLNSYRKWVGILHEIGNALEEDSFEEQKRKLLAFKRQLNKELKKEMGESHE